MFSFGACKPQTEKINGVSFVASKHEIDHTNIKPVVKVNANYAAIMPFGFIEDISHPDIIFNTDRQWFGERKDGVIQYIKTLRKHNIKIMLKPQIWVWRGKYTGLIKMESEAHWQLLETAYSRFILEYAQLAETMKVPIFCIGTELEKFIENRPEYWKNLILKIKAIYKGKLTYAANWDEFKRTLFWDQLDFIGIDAYFPVSEAKTPTIEDCLKGWEPYKLVIKTMAEKYNKAVLFTEYGYRSVDYTGKEPWQTSRASGGNNPLAQTNAMTALYETFWHEPWFAGGFVWKWFHNHTEVGGLENNRFTPQNKPAEEVIRKQYQLQ
ncbi:glycoside hydrolase [Tamlana fucoidanivorans]|uniref:Glycoside hydrolase n=2 Tax=Allotamlana fucoidanivorans TaxID=2583814 RepID=A0A5C4SJQ5_9FLAO|nr:glycoside hydrolase [Tamlana fucoidanivorans]